MENDLKKKWKTNQSTKINLIGCDTIVNSPSWNFSLLCETVSAMCSVLYQENIPYLIQIGYYTANPNLTKRESKCPV